MKKYNKFMGLILICVASAASYAHKDHIGTATKQHFDVPKGASAQINELYGKRVEPIFRRSCFDCHSQNVNYPWYYKLPGVSRLINSDISQAREHLDLTAGFPFKGHGAPFEDLEAIEAAVTDNTMPPFRYWVLHWNARLSEDERVVILEWTRESQRLLFESKK